MFTKRILGVAGMVAAVAALGQLPAHAAVNLNTGAGSLTYATETLTTTIDVSGETYHVLAAPSSGRLSFTAEVGRAVAGGETIQVRFNLGNMVFAGSTVPTLAIAGASAATVTSLSGGAEGDANARFSVTAGASEPIAATAVMTLTVRALGVLVDQAGTARVGTRVTGPFVGTDDVIAFRVASGLRETVVPASPVVKFADGFRSFAGELVASVGHLLVGPPPGTGAARVFAAGNSAPASLENTLSATASDSTVTFSGELGFTNDVFLSDTADCGTKDEEGIVNSSNDAWVAVNLAAVNNKHLCIEVDGVNSIPETTGYQAAVSYGGIASAAFPPGDANLVLGKVIRDGTTVTFPFVTIDPSVNFRFVLTNTGSEPVPYSFDFTTPAETDAEVQPRAKGTLAANSTLILRSTHVVRLSGARPYTAATLVLDAPRDNLEISSIQLSRADGSTDTVRY